MAGGDTADFGGPLIEPDPDNPGWLIWHYGERDSGRYNQLVLGPLRMRKEADGKVRLRLAPSRIHTNPFGALHGGLIMSLIDISLFTCWRLSTRNEAKGAVTLELSNQFVGRGDPEQPVDALTEIVRETGRLVFLRGQVMQGAEIISSFSGIIRKSG